MTATTPLDPQSTPSSTSHTPARQPATDIFNALLGAIIPAPSLDKSGGIGRKGAPPAQQKQRSADPLASINPTDAAVAQMATRGPAKATVAAAEADSTSPSSTPVPRSPAKPGQAAKPQQGAPSADTGPTAARSISPSDSAATASPGPGAAAPVHTPNTPGASARLHASPTAVRAVTQAGSQSALTRLVNPAPTHPNSASPQRAILRPVVAHQAQPRPTQRPSPQPQAPERPQDPEADFATQLSRGFSAILRQNGGSLTMHLQPHDLGELTIRMDLAPGKVTAAFEVQSDQARQLLDQNLSSLRSALEARGLGVDSLTVHVNERSAQDAPTRAEPESRGGANPDGGTSGHRGESGTDRPPAHAFTARSAPSSPEADATGLDTGGALVIRLALDAVA